MSIKVMEEDYDDEEIFTEFLQTFFQLIESKGSVKIN